jgi:hypothetical protein|tara:strand:- start:1179 stop:1307 length:129 start_codon:yes stop_codon:yes gene_type:complete
MNKHLLELRISNVKKALLKVKPNSWAEEYWTRVLVYLYNVDK